MLRKRGRGRSKSGRKETKVGKLGEIKRKKGAKGSDFSSKQPAKLVKLSTYRL